MATSSGNLGRPLGVLLSLDIREVIIVLGRCAKGALNVHLIGLDIPLAGEEIRGFPEVVNGINLKTFDNCRLLGVIGRNKQAASAGLPYRQGDGENALYPPYFPAECELSYEGKVRQSCRRQMILGGQDADGDGQIETGPLLLDVGRSKNFLTRSCIARYKGKYDRTKD
jgi:hypothetical protein